MSLEGPMRPSPLTAPAINRDFVGALDELVAQARQGQRRDSRFFKPAQRVALQPYAGPARPAPR